MFNTGYIPLVAMNALDFVVILLFAFYIIRNWSKDLWLIFTWAIVFSLFCLDISLYYYFTMNVLPLDTITSVAYNCKSLPDDVFSTQIGDFYDDHY